MSKMDWRFLTDFTAANPIGGTDCSITGVDSSYQMKTSPKVRIWQR